MDLRTAHGQSQVTSKQMTQSRSSTRSTQIGPSPMSRRPPMSDLPTLRNDHTSTGSHPLQTSLICTSPEYTDQPRLQCQNHSQQASTYQYRTNSHVPKKHGDRSAVYILNEPSATTCHPAQISHVHPTVPTQLRQSPSSPNTPWKPPPKSLSPVPKPDNIVNTEGDQTDSAMICLHLHFTHLLLPLTLVPLVLTPFHPTHSES